VDEQLGTVGDIRFCDRSDARDAGLRLAFQAIEGNTD
jgi:hypothetical protein